MAGSAGHVHYRQQYVRCGKPGCRRCASGPGHGPYWYAVWREGARVRTRYVGKILPPDVAVEVLGAASPAKPAVPSEAPRAAVESDSTAIRPRLRIWILGQFSLESAGVMVPESAWRRQSATVVLKLLLLADFRRLPREHIAAHLWPDAGAITARNQLASAVHALRRALEPNLRVGAHSRYLRQEGVNLTLRLGQDDWVDYLSFEALLAESATAVDPLPLLEQAAALYGGDLMPEEQNSWCVAAREALRLRWHGALLALAEARAAHRQLDAAASTLARLLKADPANEEAARRLMSLLGRQGRRGEALRLYEQVREALREDLGAEPMPETLALADALRAGTPPPRPRQARAGEPAGSASTRSVVPTLVGRVSELDRLRAAMLAAREGQGQILLLSGTAGIGKTRLAEEAATTATLLGFTVLWGRAAESEQELPYAPIAEALHAYIHTRPPGALRRDLAGAEAVRSIVPEVVAILPSLAELPPLEHPGAERLRLWTAVRTLLAAAAASRPVLLILEDLQWADEASLGMLTFLARRGRDLRIVLLGTMRDDQLPEGHPLYGLVREGQREGILAQVLVAGLSTEEVGELAAQRLGAVLSATQTGALRDQCDGNPLFINELLTLLREPGKQTGAELLAAVVSGTAALPGSILLTLRQRLERRSPACRALLRIGAVIGERFPITLLSRVAGQKADTFDRALDEAVAGGLLREDAIGEQGGYILAHALLRRVLYEEMAPAQRKRLHAQIAEGLAEHVLPGSEPNVAAVAYHYGQSDERLAAGIWLERAGDRAAGLHAVADARTHYGRARDLLEHLATRAPDADAERAALARLTEKLGNLLLLDGEYAAAQQHFAQARPLVDDIGQRAELWRKEGVTWEKRGDFERALAAFSAAEHMDAAPSGSEAVGKDGRYVLPVEVQADLELSRGDVHWSRGDFEAAEAAAARALAALHDQPEGAALARATYLLGHVAEVRGDYGNSEERYRHSLAIRERIDDQQGIASCWYGLGLVAYDRGDPARSEEYHRRALAIRERIGDLWGMAFSWGKLARVAQYQGHYAQAEECGRRSLAIPERIGSQPGIARSVYQSGQVARERGDYAEAAAYGERGLHIQERIGDQWGCSNSLNDLGDVALDRGDFALAERYYQRGLAIKEHLGDQLGIAGCLHSLGVLACERGERGVAASLGRQARHLARRIGARGMEATAALGQAATALRAGRMRLAAPLIAHGRALAAGYGSARTVVLGTLAAAALARQQGDIPVAAALARDALQLALRGQFRREEALAQRLMGQCAQAGGDAGAAIRPLQAACALLDAIGAATELARTRVLLSDALVARAGQDEDKPVYAEAVALRAAALASLAAHGASP